MSSMDGLRTRLAGRYELDEVIGRGGMSTVYRATDAVLGRIVAVKVLDFGIARSMRPRSRRPSPSSAPPPTWLQSRRRANPPTRAPTSIRSAACCTQSCPDPRRSPATWRRPSCTSTSTPRPARSGTSCRPHRRRSPDSSIGCSPSLLATARSPRARFVTDSGRCSIQRHQRWRWAARRRRPQWRLPAGAPDALAGAPDARTAPTRPLSPPRPRRTRRRGPLVAIGLLVLLIAAGAIASGGGSSRGNLFNTRTNPPPARTRLHATSPAARATPPSTPPPANVTPPPNQARGPTAKPPGHGESPGHAKQHGRGGDNGNGNGDAGDGGD